MPEQSKFLRYNTEDLKKIGKGAGIAFAGVGLVFFLGVFDFLDADAVTAFYTAIGGIVVNAVVKLLSGSVK